MAQGRSIESMYGRRSFETGPATYTDEGFMDTIHTATGLADFRGTATVVDLMSGPGKIAAGLRKRAPQHRYFALDFSGAQLAKVPEGIETLQADVRAMDIDPDFADVVVVRYGLKDIPQEQQPGVFAGISKILKPGGVLVIADMVSPDGMKIRTNHQHSLKQELGGRDVVRDGRCNIPTEEGWRDLLENAGFQAERIVDYTSNVSTANWVSGNQITEEQRRAMDQLLAGEPRWFKFRFNVRGISPVKIDYPVVVIKAVKPDTAVGDQIEPSGIIERIVYGAAQ